MSRLTANLFMNSFNENLECLKTVLKRKDLWQDLCDAYKEALCEIADRTRLVDLSTAFGSTIRFEVVNPNSPRRIVVVKEIPISEIGNLNTFITDPNEDLWEG